MAAIWLRIDELNNSNANLVCVVARVQSINSAQRMLVVHEDHEEKRTSSTLQISLVNLRTPMTTPSSILSPGQYVQIYGKVVRRGDDLIRVDAQFIRPLCIDFDMNKYNQGLMLTHRYMSDVNDESVLDNRITKSCRPMQQLNRLYHLHFDCVVLI